MKNKEAAAKILLESGWTLEEVLEVLGFLQDTFKVEKHFIPYVIPAPVPAYPYYPRPFNPWGEIIITCGDTTTIEGANSTANIEALQ